MSTHFCLPIAVNDPNALLGAVLNELGLSERFLIQALASNGMRPTLSNTGKLDLRRMGAFEWVWICRELRLSVDSYSYGYHRFTHILKIGEAILDGDYDFPITNGIRALFKKFIARSRQSLRQERSHYGDDLWRRILESRRSERRLRRIKRKQNKRKRASVRRKYVKLLVQADIGAPVIIRKRTSRNKSLSKFNFNRSARDGKKLSESISKT